MPRLKIKLLGPFFSRAKVHKTGFEVEARIDLFKKYNFTEYEWSDKDQLCIYVKFPDNNVTWISVERLNELIKQVVVRIENPWVYKSLLEEMYTNPRKVDGMFNNFVYAVQMGDYNEQKMRPLVTFC